VFERYFEYHAASGELRPSTVADPTDRLRAEVTISMLNLNRPGLCSARIRALRQGFDEYLDEHPYRFLYDLLNGEFDATATNAVP
jgi:hypothetical protein